MFVRKKILSILFLSVFTVPLISMIAYLASAKINAHLMEEKLEQSSLQTIYVSANKLIWLKKGKEVLINGKLFDIKSSENNNGEIKLTGLFDTAEDAIVKKIAALENNKNNSSSPVCSLLVNLFCPAVLQQNNLIVIPEWLPYGNKFSDAACAKYIIPFIGVNTPPPNA
jgi:hypothetical protein